MAHPAPSLLIPEAAREARTALVAALGTENNPGQWMLFMDAVTAHLPDVLSGNGRPPAAAIRHSVIGQYGFKSWRQMIEASNTDGGFGWNYSTWKAWRRAWAVVTVHPWLRDERVTYSEVIQLSLKLKKAAPEQPPQNMAEALAIVAEVKSQAAAIDARESNSNPDSSQLEYEQMARSRTARRIRDLRNKRYYLSKQYRELDDRVHQLGQDLATANQALADTQRRLRWHRERTVWQHIGQAMKQLVQKLIGH